MEQLRRLYHALAVVLLLCVFCPAHGTFYRILERGECPSSFCGGYYLRKINTRTIVFVADIDFSDVYPDAVETYNRFTNVSGTDLVVFDGTLAPYVEPLFNQLNVSRIYLGMPGLNASEAITGDPSITFYYVSFPTFDVGGTTAIRLSKANSNRTVWVTQNGSQFSVSPTLFVDTAWQERQVLSFGALFTSPKLYSRDVVSATGVFISIPVMSGPCMMAPEPVCDPANSITTHTRSPDLCFRGTCSSNNPPGACLLFFPVCPDGYRLACWPSAPYGCNEYRCDPIFAPEASLGSC